MPPFCPWRLPPETLAIHPSSPFVIETARALAESEGYGYQTVINNTLRQALLSDKGKVAKPDQNTAVTKVGHFKKGITASELKSLEKKLSEALSEIHHVMEVEVRSYPKNQNPHAWIDKKGAN